MIILLFIILPLLVFLTSGKDGKGNVTKAAAGCWLYVIALAFIFSLLASVR